eukprot:Skav205792  [mRNA]  locus=scaffold340:415268:417485:- [translate_table: standard]
MCRGESSEDIVSFNTVLSALKRSRTYSICLAALGPGAAGSKVLKEIVEEMRCSSVSKGVQAEPCPQLVRPIWLHDLDQPFKPKLSM